MQELFEEVRELDPGLTDAIDEAHVPMHVLRLWLDKQTGDEWIDIGFARRDGPRTPFRPGLRERMQPLTSRFVTSAFGGVKRARTLYTFFTRRGFRYPVIGQIVVFTSLSAGESPASEGVLVRDRAIRLLHYSHDSYGLGHLSRTLAIARHFRERSQGGEVAQLVVSGSAVEPSRSRVPEGTDLIRLPAAVKVGAERYEPRTLSGSFEALRDLRAEIVLAAARAFRPDLLLVDHAPAGLGGEIIPTLRELRSSAPATRLVVGLRDIVDDAADVRSAWMRAGVYDLLDDVYDLILVYGDRDVYDAVVEYGLSRRAAFRLRYVGYLGRRQLPPRITPAAGPPGRLLATAGGGEDGYALFRALLAGLRRRPRSFTTTVVTGPLMSAHDRSRLEQLAADNESVELRSQVDNLEAELVRANAVVSMGGYNSLCEILTQGVPAVIIPRVAPRREQLIRARAFERRGLVRMIHPDDLTPGRVLSEVDAALGEERRPEPPLSLDGLDRTTAALTEVLASRPHVSPGAAQRPEMRRVD